MAKRHLTIDEEEFPKCAVCLNTWLGKDPRILQCQHTYCYECLEKLTVENDKLTCPQCRQSHPILDNCIDNIPKNQLSVVGRKVKKECIPIPSKKLSKLKNYGSFKNSDCFGLVEKGLFYLKDKKIHFIRAVDSYDRIFALENLVDNFEVGNKYLITFSYISIYEDLSDHEHGEEYLCTELEKNVVCTYDWELEEKEKDKCFEQHTINELFDVAGTFFKGYTDDTNAYFMVDRGDRGKTTILLYHNGKSQWNTQECFEIIQIFSQGTVGYRNRKVFFLNKEGKKTKSVEIYQDFKEIREIKPFGFFVIVEECGEEENKKNVLYFYDYKFDKNQEIVECKELLATANNGLVCLRGVKGEKEDDVIVFQFENNNQESQSD